ncbi:hypothetical protein [Sabulibacter ruber]|uniref:hypothetical protein n=1 Tax=Sabulibacter ruber TaxID=2811901 RepID=UPI001A970816|nr:hypothetical protein [Sabulibacter ruber]
MMKRIATGLLSLVFSLLMVSAQAGINPTEAKMDKIMNTYASKMKLAFQEKDDQKTITMLKNASNEAGAEMRKLKPELEKWAQEVKALGEAEKEAFQKRFQAKPYFKSIFELMFDPSVSKRLQANPALAKALEEGNAAFPNFKSDRDSNIIEEPAEEDGE